MSRRHTRTHESMRMQIKKKVLSSALLTPGIRSEILKGWRRQYSHEVMVLVYSDNDYSFYTYIHSLAEK